MKKMSLITYIVTLVLSVGIVFADGEQTDSGFKTIIKTDCTTEYGGAVNCKEVEVTEEVPKEEVPEDQQLEKALEPDTGIAEVAVILSALILGGVGFFVLAQHQMKM